VLDFGLAKYSASTDDLTRSVHPLTEAGSLVGTVSYMAPEICQGAPADARSDLWALGVVLYEMLTGQRPFAGATPFEVAAAIMREEPPPLPDRVPREIQLMVQALLEKSPDRRPHTATDVRERLEEISGAEPRRARAANAPAAARTVTGSPASSNAEANDAFALAAHFMRVQNDLTRGQTLLERALEIDPHFA
jgi:serine/threonine-protein kinase